MLHILSVDDLDNDFLISLWEEALSNQGSSNANL